VAVRRGEARQKADRRSALAGGNPEEQKGEGCMVFGNMVVKKVPGNFHISCHAHANLIHVFFAEEMMNVSHSIHHLSFGDEGKEGAGDARACARHGSACSLRRWRSARRSDAGQQPAQQRQTHRQEADGERLWRLARLV
jgi:hypothetical protein